MPVIFSYGTLQQKSVQLATFGRRLAGQPDELAGFEPGESEITDPEVRAMSGLSHHANAVFTGRPDSRVPGVRFEITEAELAAADRYERDAGYKRIEVTLASGNKAWVYVDERTLSGA